MKEFWNMIQLLCISTYHLLVYFLGGHDDMLIALAFFSGADYITGLMCAVIDKKKLSNEVGKGICLKALAFIVVGLANVLDLAVFGAESMCILRNSVILFYLSNDGASLLDNAAHLNLPVPTKLKDVLVHLHGRAETNDNGNVETDNKKDDIYH